MPAPTKPCLWLPTPGRNAALCTAWLTKTEGDLKVSLERTIATMQAVLTRTLEHADRAAEKAGTDKPSPAQMELKLIQSLREIQNPPAWTAAEILTDIKG